MNNVDKVGLLDGFNWKPKGHYTDGKSYKLYELKRKKVKEDDTFTFEEGILTWKTSIEKGMIRDTCPECGNKVEYMRNNTYLYWFPICKHCGFGITELFNTEEAIRTRELRTKAIQKALQRKKQKEEGRKIEHWKYCKKCGERLMDWIGMKNVCCNTECELSFKEQE